MLMCTPQLTYCPIRWTTDPVEMKIHKSVVMTCGQPSATFMVTAISKALTNIKITNIRNNLRTARVVQTNCKLPKTEMLIKFRSPNHLDALNDWNWISFCKATNIGLLSWQWCSLLQGSGSNRTSSLWSHIESSGPKTKKYKFIQGWRKNRPTKCTN